MKLKAGLTIALLALVPLIPYALVGYAGHDFRQHIPSWMELRDFWRAGQLFPGWAEKANFTLGDPRFSFYPPISFLIGGAISMVLPILAAPAAFVWLALVLSGLSMYSASGPFVAEEDRLKAAVLYMFSPYLLTTGLVRFAAGELYTLAWLPLIFLFFYQALWLKQRRAIVLLGGGLALSWLTNIPASIVLLYGLLPVAAIIAIHRKSIRPLISFLAAEAIAGALTAFYLLPVLAEQGWIHKDAVLRDSFDLFFLFLPLSKVQLRHFSFTCWAIACIGTALVAIYALSTRRKLREDNAMRTWLEIALVSFLFQLPFTAFLWRHLPQLRFADFPYRFLAQIGVAVPLALFAKSTPKVFRIPSYILLGLLALSPVAMYVQSQRSADRYPSLASMVSDWNREGYRAWPEFVPAGATRPTTPTGFPPAALADKTAAPDCTVTLESPGVGRKILETNSSTACQAQVAIYYYPYWQAIDESGHALAIGRNSYGLMLITVPAGSHAVRLVYHRHSSVRTISLLISLVSLLLVVVFLFVSNRITSPAKKIQSQKEAPASVG